MLERSDSADWMSAKRLAGISSSDLRGMSAPFKYVVVGAKMEQSSRGELEDGSGELGGGKNEDEADVGDACVVM